jgi:hypothetical protein
MNLRNRTFFGFLLWMLSYMTFCHILISRLYQLQTHSPETPGVMMVLIFSIGTFFYSFFFDKITGPSPLENRLVMTHARLIRVFDNGKDGAWMKKETHHLVSELLEAVENGGIRSNTFIDLNLNQALVSEALMNRYGLERLPSEAVRKGLPTNIWPVVHHYLIKKEG